MKRINDFIRKIHPLKFKIGLRYKLILLFFLISTPSILTLFVFSMIDRTITSQTDSYQKAITASSQKLVKHFLLSCQKSLSALGDSTHFQNSVRDKNIIKIRADLERIHKKHKTFSFIALAKRRPDRKIHIISAYPKRYRNLTANTKIHNFIEWNFRHPSEHISRVFEYRKQREVFVVVPMRNAILIAGINLEMLSNLLERVKPLKESTFILLDSDKNAILGYEGKFDIEIPDAAGLIRFNNEKTVAYYNTISGVEWTILLASPTNIIYRSSIHLRRLILIFILLGLVIIAILAFHFSKKITVPIVQLSKGARILGEGNLSYRITINTGDELEELAEEFNSMAQKLKNSYNSMNEKIRNATRDLQDAYKEIGKKNKELKKSDRLKSEFLASMSHELRTPRNAIIGFNSLLKDGAYGKVSEKQKDIYSKIMRNAFHLLNLINDILDLSKIEADKMELFPEKFQLNLLLNDIKEEVQPLASEKELDFIVDIKGEIEYYQDYTRMRQIIMNLISNAIKFTKSGTITIKAEKTNEGLFIEVKDTGIGIKEEDLKTIFKEFIQADGSITREFGGTGLGLSIAKKFLNLMGGKIEVKSKWQQGTSFRITLP